MKMKLFTAVSMFMVALFTHAKWDEKNPDYWRYEPVTIKVIDLSSSAIQNTVIPFNLEEEELNDGYKWYVITEMVNKGKIKVIEEDSSDKQDCDIFKLKFTKVGEYHFRFVYANMKNKGDVKILINYTMRVKAPKKAPTNKGIKK